MTTKDQKLTIAGAMAEELRTYRYIAAHSHSVTTRSFAAAPNETTRQNVSEDVLAAQRKRYEQTSTHDTVRVLRF